MHDQGNHNFYNIVCKVYFFIILLYHIKSLNKKFPLLETLRFRKVSKSVLNYEFIHNYYKYFPFFIRNKRTNFNKEMFCKAIIISNFTLHYPRFVSVLCHLVKQNHRGKDRESNKKEKTIVSFYHNLLRVRLVFLFRCLLFSWFA